MNRKLDIGGVLERLFEVYRAQFTLLVPAALILFIPIAVLNGALAEGGGVGVLLVSAILGFVANFWFQGMAIEAVRDIQDGRRDFSIGGLFQSVMPVLPKLIGVGLLAGIGIGIGFLLLIVPGLILLTLWAVVGPAVVIERRGLDAISRSMQLVKGNAWSVFGVIVIVFLIQFAAGLVLGLLFGAADSFLGQALATLISQALVAPIGAIAAALMYLRLREVHGEGSPSAAGVGAAEESPFFGSGPSGAEQSAFGGPGSSASEALGGPSEASQEPAGPAPPSAPAPPSSGATSGDPLWAPPTTQGDPLDEPRHGEDRPPGPPPAGA